MSELHQFARNVYSQHGEDGILEEIFRLLDIQEGYFVEFGAWNGMHLSNAYRLVEDGWQGCYIEADSTRFMSLLTNVPQSSIRKVNRFVQEDGRDSLDRILDDIDAPSTFDLLSIDVDGNDLSIWRGLRTHRAKCVVIEYNPTIPFDTVFENPSGKSWGNSALAICTLAKSTNYSLIAATATNLIFLDNASLALHGEPIPITLDEIGSGDRYFWGYDGSLLRSSHGTVTAPEIFRIPWSKDVAFQPIPKSLRRYDDQRSMTSMLRRTFTTTIAVILRPKAAVKEVRRRAVGISSDRNSAQDRTP